jgi:GH15 family glucan-1,4-alpha-glucosidase
MPSRIEDYALIGDCETAALVARDGSIDWLCWPRFDSDACFAALLGTDAHGHWSIAPHDPKARITRRYRTDTLILETRFETADAAATLTDFMPLRGRNSHIVRIVSGERGSLAMRQELVLRFGYGACVPWVTRMPDRTVRAIAGPDMILLRTPVDVHGEDFKTVGDFTVSAGQRVPFVLSYAHSHLTPPEAIDPFAALEATEAFWTDWSSKCRRQGPWGETVHRSLITLKALTYAPTGGIIAAPTTSLPEQIGGARNWDYRFCWLRDSTLTLLALLNCGYVDEAQAWRDWVQRAVAGSPQQMQVIYGIGGERRLTEWEVPWLPGYEGSKPIRIGNAAHAQLQLDVYGELMDAFHQARRSGLAANESGWELQLAMLEHLEKIWTEPDECIWEMRGGPQQFTYSKVMAWVAFDRAIQSAEMFGLKGPIERWRALCVRIHADVCAHGFDPSLNCFVQVYGGQELDASLLLIPAVGFLSPHDPRVRGTVEAIERRLLVDGFLLRYDTEETLDGLSPGEGAFLACSFWLVDVYTLMGRHEDARRMFEKLLTLRNDVGLLSEEYDPRSRRLVGNFPQAFSHIALINSAFNLSRVSKPVEQRVSKDALPQEEQPERIANGGLVVAADRSRTHMSRDARDLADAGIPNNRIEP